MYRRRVKTKVIETKIGKMDISMQGLSTTLVSIPKADTSKIDIPMQTLSTTSFTIPKADVSSQVV